MFSTQSGWAIEKTSPIDRDTQRWAVVEHDLHSPWFYVTIKLLEDGFDYERTLLIADVLQLQSMLETLPEESALEAIMLVSPHRMNGSGSWKMEKVLTMDQVWDEENYPLTYQFTVEGGKNYNSTLYEPRSTPPHRRHRIYQSK